MNQANRFNGKGDGERHSSQRIATRVITEEGNYFEETLKGTWEDALLVGS